VFGRAGGELWFGVVAVLNNPDEDPSRSGGRSVAASDVSVEGGCVGRRVMHLNDDGMSSFKFSDSAGGKAA
jgi:hypothetical protein